MFPIEIHPISYKGCVEVMKSVRILNQKGTYTKFVLQTNIFINNLSYTPFAFFNVFFFTFGFFNDF